MPRLGHIQQQLVKWITCGGRTYIGASSRVPEGVFLKGFTIDELEPSLKRLIKRGIIKEINPCIYEMVNK